MSCYDINPEALKQFGRLVKEGRENIRDKHNCEISQREFAKIVNVSNSTISRIEKGTINSAIDLQVFIAITETLELTEEQIISLYRIATYKEEKIQKTIEKDIEELQKGYVNKLEIEIDILKSLRNEIDNMIEVKKEIQKVNKK